MRELARDALSDSQDHSRVESATALQRFLCVVRKLALATVRCEHSERTHRMRFGTAKSGCCELREVFCGSYVRTTLTTRQAGDGGKLGAPCNDASRRTAGLGALLLASAELVSIRLRETESMYVPYSLANRLLENESTVQEWRSGERRKEGME